MQTLERENFTPVADKDKRSATENKGLMIDTILQLNIMY